MLYLTCTTITSVNFAHYGVSIAKDRVSVDCGTSQYRNIPAGGEWAGKVRKGAHTFKRNKFANEGLKIIIKERRFAENGKLLKCFDMNIKINE